MSALWNDPSDEQRAAYVEWLAQRPDHIRWIARNFDPWTMYRLKATGQRVQLLGFDEMQDGRVTLRIYAERAELPGITGVQVFGINPDEIEPWQDES